MLMTGAVWRTSDQTDQPHVCVLSGILRIVESFADFESIVVRKESIQTRMARGLHTDRDEREETREEIT